MNGSTETSSHKYIAVTSESLLCWRFEDVLQHETRSTCGGVGLGGGGEGGEDIGDGRIRWAEKKGGKRGFS